MPHLKPLTLLHLEKTRCFLEGVYSYLCKVGKITPTVINPYDPESRDYLEFDLGRQEADYLYRVSTVDRKALIASIEKLAGKLESVDWISIKTHDLIRLCDAVESTWQ